MLKRISIGEYMIKRIVRQYVLYIRSSCNVRHTQKGGEGRGKVCRGQACDRLTERYAPGNVFTQAGPDREGRSGLYAR